MTRNSFPVRLPVFGAGLLAAALSAACASTGAVPRPFPSPESQPAAAAPAPEAPPTVAPALAAIVTAALALQGRPYRNGGSDPHDGFDCSGFTQYVFSQEGVRLPREVRDQFRVGTRVREIAPGDLLFFKTSRRGVSHVGIALDGDRFVHAPSSNGVVRIDRLSAPYWSRRFVAAHRVD